MEYNDFSLLERVFWLNDEICSELMRISNTITGWEFKDTEFYAKYETIRQEMFPFLQIGNIENDQFRMSF